MGWSVPDGCRPSTTVYTELPQSSAVRRRGTLEGGVTPSSAGSYTCTQSGLLRGPVVFHALHKDGVHRLQARPLTTCLKKQRRGYSLRAHTCASWNISKAHNAPPTLTVTYIQSPRPHTSPTDYKTDAIESHESRRHLETLTESTTLTHQSWTLTSCTCVSILFILRGKHRADVRGEEAHREALLSSHSTRPVQLTGSQPD